MATQMLSNRKVGRLAPLRAGTSRCHHRRRGDRPVGVVAVAVAALSASSSSSSAAAAAATFELFRPPGARPQPSCPPLVHIPGADGTGVSLGRQAALLSDAGFDVWSSRFDFGEGEGNNKDEDPWEPLVAAAAAAFEAAFEEGRGDEPRRLPTIVAESFGACLALRLAARKPEGFASALVLLNSATALSSSSPSSSTSPSPSPSSPSSLGPARSLSSALVGVAAATGIARILPVPVYRGAAAVLTPLLLDARGRGAEERRNNGGSGGEEGSEEEDGCAALLAAATTMMSLGRREGASRATTDGVAKRLELLARADPGEASLRRVGARTLLVASARDALLPSVSEAGRLFRVLPNARRLLLPDSGHAALLEGRLDLAKELERAGFGPGSVVVSDDEGARGGGGGAGGSGEEEASSTTTSPSSPSSLPTTPWSLPDQEFDGALESLRPLRELVSPLITGGEYLESLTSSSSFSASSSRSSSPPPLSSKSKPTAAKNPSSSSSTSDRSSPILFVGNHSRFGIYDLVFVLAELYARGIRARGLAHKNHFDTGSPLGPVFKRFGAVAASPRAAFRLLAEGEAVLLFPGGAAEVNKGKGEDYKLLWKEEADFVRVSRTGGESEEICFFSKRRRFFFSIGDDKDKKKLNLEQRPKQNKKNSPTSARCALPRMQNSALRGCRGRRGIFRDARPEGTTRKPAYRPFGKSGVRIFGSRRRGGAPAARRAAVHRRAPAGLPDPAAAAGEALHRVRAPARRRRDDRRGGARRSLRQSQSGGGGGDREAEGREGRGSAEADEREAARGRHEVSAAEARVLNFFVYSLLLFYTLHSATRSKKAELKKCVYVSHSGKYKGMKKEECGEKGGKEYDGVWDEKEGKKKRASQN